MTDEDGGPQYAMNVAITTLQNRYKTLQSFADGLEKENMRLKMQCKRSEVPGTEVEELKAKIVKLTEQKGKLRRDLINVTNENKELWEKLSKIVQVNKSLGSHLTKINDSLNQHTKKGLIRSTTFTQSDSDLKTVNKAINENNRISLELEDVSLKAITNLTKEKTELQAQCTEMDELQKSLSLGYLNDDPDNSLVENMEEHLIDLKVIKDKLNEQNKTFEKSLNDMQLSVLLCTCKNQLVNNSKSEEKIVKEGLNEDEMQLQSLARWGTPENSNQFLKENIVRNCCPMCSQEFPEMVMEDFVKHVETHFKLT
nr:protein spindle-F [Onthophagus taurus]